MNRSSDSDGPLAARILRLANERRMTSDQFPGLDLPQRQGYQSLHENDPETLRDEIFTSAPCEFPPPRLRFL